MALKAAIYILCLLASLGCAAVLFASFRRNATRLALWTALCFALLALNNLFVVLDILVLPDVDLVPARKLTSLAAAAVMVAGFVWETE